MTLTSIKCFSFTLVSKQALLEISKGLKSFSLKIFSTRHSKFNSMWKQQKKRGEKKARRFMVIYVPFLFCLSPSLVRIPLLVPTFVIRLSGDANQILSTCKFSKLTAKKNVLRELYLIFGFCYASFLCLRWSMSSLWYLMHTRVYWHQKMHDVKHGMQWRPQIRGENCSWIFPTLSSRSSNIKRKKKDDDI